MIDTIVFTGDPTSARMNFDLERYTAWKRKDGTEVVTEVLYKKTEHYRVFYSPSYNRARIECNLSKILFDHNIYNYEKSPNILNTVIRRLGDYFFLPNTYYVSRCDIGGVRQYDARLDADRVLEGFRKARFEGARLRKYKHQNYDNSVFYSSANWSIKIYNKGHEMKNHGEIPEPHLFNMLRFEKTYRTGEMERLGMQKTPHYGIHIDSFDVGTLVHDFETVFAKWEQRANPVIVNAKGMLGLVAIVDALTRQNDDQNGAIDDLVNNGTISRATLSRYHTLKHKTSNLFQGEKSVSFPYNLPAEKRNRMGYVYNFGFANIL